MKKISMLVLSAISMMLIVIPAGAEYLEVRGRIANETGDDYINLSSNNINWGPRNFAGFFYDVDYSLGSEHLIIDQKGLNGSSVSARTIKKGNLVYSTNGDNKILNVVKYQFNNNYAQAKAKGLKGFDIGQMSPKEGHFKVVGWIAKKNIAVNKTYKLAEPAIEQNKTEVTSIGVGNWSVGKGWKLRIISINSSTKSMKFALYKDGIKKDEKILKEGYIYTYAQNIAGETNVPLFLTYAHNISKTTVKLKYTWAIDTNVALIKVGNKYGVFNTTAANINIIELKNSNPITLNRDSNINLMRNLGFRVADRQVLRFYPKIDYRSCTI